MAKKLRPPTPRTKPKIAKGSKSKSKPTKKKVEKKKVEKKKTIKKKIIQKPIRYRRGIPKEMVRVELSLIGNKEIKTGTLLEFSYGKQQKPGKVGGWKNDPKPKLLVFYDDGVDYIEGLNTNYLSDYYIRKLKQILMRFPGIEGEQLYDIIKRTASYAIAKGYRKYIRSSVRNEYVFMYEDQLARLIDEPFMVEDEDEYN